MSNPITNSNDVSNAIIRHARYVQLYNKILEQVELTKLLREPQILGIEAPRDVGKTILIRDFSRGYPRKIVGTRKIVPVLSVTTPSPIDILGIGKEMLRCIGDPGADDYDDIGIINHKLIQYIAQDCDTMLVIIDDFHYLLEPGTVEAYFRVSNWLKYLANAIGKPFVLTSTEGKLSKMLQSNPQMMDMLAVEKFEPFAFDVANPVTIQEFGDFLGEMEVLVGLDLPWRYDEDVDLVYRMHYATLGAVGAVKRLMLIAADKARKKKADRLEMEILRQVFQEQVRKGLKRKHNPFDPGWGDWFEPPRNG